MSSQSTGPTPGHKRKHEGQPLPSSGPNEISTAQYKNHGTAAIAMPKQGPCPEGPVFVAQPNVGNIFIKLNVNAHGSIKQDEYFRQLGSTDLVRLLRTHWQNLVDTYGIPDGLPDPPKSPFTPKAYNDRDHYALFGVLCWLLDRPDKPFVINLWGTTDRNEVLWVLELDKAVFPQGFVRGSGQHNRSVTGRYPWAQCSRVPAPVPAQAQAQAQSSPVPTVTISVSSPQGSPRIGATVPPRQQSVIPLSKYVPQAVPVLPHQRPAPPATIYDLRNSCTITSTASQTNSGRLIVQVVNGKAHLCNYQVWGNLANDAMAACQRNPALLTGTSALWPQQPTTRDELENYARNCIEWLFTVNAQIKQHSATPFYLKINTLDNRYELHKNPVWAI